MPADFSQYVNLRIFDKEPGDIYLDSIELARLTLPDFNLRVGTPEDAMFQAAAYMSALNIAAINRIPDRLMGGIMSMLGFERQGAVAAEVDVVITLNTYDGGTIPEGTVFSFETLFEDQLQEYPFITTSAIEVAAVDPETSPAFPTTTTTLKCLTTGVIPPIDGNVELTTISSGTNILSCITDDPSNFSNGINADRDEDYLSKAATYMRSLSSSLTKASQVDSYTLTAYPNIVSRCKTYDLTNGDTTDGDIGVKREIGLITTYLNNNVATIETSEEHLFVVGDVVDIEIYNNASQSAIYNGEHTITAAGSTTFSFSRTFTNTASTTITNASVYTGQDIPGYATVFAYGINAELTQLEKDQIIADIADRAVAGVTFQILDPTLASLSISGAIAINQNYVASDVQESIENALTDFLSPATFPYTYDRVRQSQLVSLISNIPGVVYVNDLTLSPSGTDWLPQLGADLLFRRKGTLPLLSPEDISFTYTVVDLE